MNDIAKALLLAHRPTPPPPKPKDAASNRVAKGVNFDGGLIKDQGFGRTDTIPLNLPSGSYVLPADVVSGLGQGNTDGGATALARLFAEWGFAVNGQPKGGRPIPSVYHRVPIIAAGGEFVIHPEIVKYYGGGSIPKGHKDLDEFVKSARAKTHKTLGSLPGPAKD
jgi:hypothetical protein